MTLTTEVRLQLLVHQIGELELQLSIKKSRAKNYRKMLARIESKSTTKKARVQLIERVRLLEIAFDKELRG